MSKKIPQCSADSLDHDIPSSRSQVDCSANIVMGCRSKTKSNQRNGETTSSSPESSSLNGDAKRSRKSRHRNKHASNPEEHVGANNDLPNARAGLVGLQSECANVWFERSMYERAESLYQRWLASSSNGTAKLNGSPPAPNSPSAVAPAPSGLACHHSDRVACHHLVQDVWVNKTNFDQAEHRFVEGSLQPSVPNFLDLPSPSQPSIPPRTPDEGYQSQVPTPATPVIQQAALTPTICQSINGLPRISVELLRAVWLEKPLYDRAEAAFYQNLYGNNSSKRPSCTSTSRSSDHPQSLVEEEEEEEEEVVVEEKRVVLQGKAEVFHALHPIQEEEEPTETQEKEGSGVCYFLHPDSERVWLDKWRYDAAENRYHGNRGGESPVKKGRRPGVDASPAPLRDKYDQTRRMEPLQAFQFLFRCLYSRILS